MKNLSAVLMLIMLSFSVTGCGDPCKDDMLTSIGDSLATMGKKGLEKDQVLMERKAARAAKCAEKTGGEMKKSLGF